MYYKKNVNMFYGKRTQHTHTLTHTQHKTQTQEPFNCWKGQKKKSTSLPPGGAIVVFQVSSASLLWKLLTKVRNKGLQTRLLVRSFQVLCCVMNFYICTLQRGGGNYRTSPSVLPHSHSLWVKASNSFYSIQPFWLSYGFVIIRCLCAKMTVSLNCG